MHGSALSRGLWGHAPPRKSRYVGVQYQRPISEGCEVSVQCVWSHKTTVTGIEYKLEQRLPYSEMKLTAFSIMNCWMTVSTTSVYYLRILPFLIHLWENIKSNELSLEEVTSAVEFGLSREALLAQQAVTLWTFDALHMPWLVQHLHQVALHDGPLTSCANEWRHLCWNSSWSHGMSILTAVRTAQQAATRTHYRKI